MREFTLTFNFKHNAGDFIASCDSDTGVVTVNLERFEALNVAEKMRVIAHEFGHSWFNATGEALY